MLSGKIGIVTAVFAVGWMPALPTPAAMLCLVAVFLPLLHASARRWRPLLTGALIGLLWGAAWGYSLLDQRLPVSVENVLVQVRGEILEPPQWRRFSGGGQRQRFSFRAATLTCPPAITACPRQPRKLLLSYYGKQPLAAGQRWQFTVRLKRPWGLANPGSFNFQSWLAQHRFAATGYVRDDVQLLLRQPPWWYSPIQRWRQRVVEVLRRDFSERPEAGVLLALSIGDRSAIDASQWTLFQRFGLNHLVVISGLHVGMVAALGFLLGRVCGRRGAYIAAALLALVYSAQAGFALSTVRALVMLFTFQLAALLGRKARPGNSLLVALTVVALIDPLASHNAGFWLSFGAVALIFYLQAMWPGLRGWRLALCLQFCLSLCLGVMASFWFGGFGWLAPVANLVAVPLLTFWIAPLCMLGALLVPLAVPIPASEAWAQWCWQLAALPVAHFLQLASGLQHYPLPLWLDYQPSLAAVFALLLGLLLVLAHRAMPLRWLALLIFLLPLYPQRQSLQRGELLITALDVGQGLAVLVQKPEGALLYDTGAGELAGPNMASSVILPYLRRLGVEELELLVISHGDRDHASGVYTLHQQLAVKQTWYGDKPLGTVAAQHACQPGMALQLGTLRVSVLHPRTQRKPAYSSNNRSCVLQLHDRGFVALLPGDIETGVELELVREHRGRLRADLLVAPHHGSRTSSSGPFLRSIYPRWVLFSRGYRNRFGHPHAVVRRRLRTMGVEILDTAVDGAVTLQVIDGKLHSLQRWRVTQRYYWH